MLRLLFGFVAGVLYGAISSVEAPEGTLAKAAMILKMFIFG